MAEILGVVIIEALTAETFVAAGGWAVTVTATPSAFAAGLVGSAALLGISTAASFLAQPQVPKQPDGAQPLKGTIPARPRGYGRARISGPYVLYDTYSIWSFDIIALHDGKISGFVYYFLNDDLVTFDSDGGVNLTVGLGATQRYVANSSSHHVYIKTKLGLATETAYSGRVTGFSPPGTIPNWSSAHRGDGIASIFLECRQSNATDFLTTYPRGLPKPSVVADLSPIYDPRDGAQSRGSSSTWLVSRNPVLQLLDYLTNDDSGGPALDWDTLVAPNLTALMAQATICDQLVTRADGSTEARYQSSGWYYKTNDPAEVIGAILATCDGWMAENGDGSISIYVGKYQTPTITLTDDHIIGMSIDHGVADEEVINEIRASYTSIDSDYREAAARPWQDTASIAEIGRVRSSAVQMPWVQSWSQARRLSKRLMLRHQAEMRGSLQLSMYGLKLLGQRWVKVQSTTVADLSDAVIEVTGLSMDLLNGRISVEWFLVDPDTIDAWDAATEEGGAPANFFGNITLNLKKPTTPTGSAVGGAIQVQFDDDTAQTNIVGHVVEYKLTSRNTWTRKYFPNPVTPSGGKITLTTSVLPAGSYNVRIASVGADYVLSQWTDATSNNAAGTTINAVSISVTI